MEHKEIIQFKHMGKNTPSIVIGDITGIQPSKEEHHHMDRDNVVSKSWCFFIMAGCHMFTIPCDSREHQQELIKKVLDDSSRDVKETAEFVLKRFKRLKSDEAYKPSRIL